MLKAPKWQCCKDSHPPSGRSSGRWCWRWSTSPPRIGLSRCSKRTGSQHTGTPVNGNATALCRARCAWSTGGGPKTARRPRLLRRARHALGGVELDAELVHQLELGLEVVDVMLLVGHDL